jgi:hypothetical protein
MILAVITTALNAWRLAIVWGVTVITSRIVQRVDAVRPHIIVVTWLILLVALFLLVRPELKTLGQMPIVIADGAHWVMGVVASVTVLYLGWVWKDALHGLLIWAGLAALWLWFYYFMNLMLILRAGFAA